MHPTKAKILASIDKSLAMVDRAIRRDFRVIASPLEHGPVRFGTALVTLPLSAASAVLGDPSYVMVTRTDDAAWDRFPLRDSPGE